MGLAKSWLLRLAAMAFVVPSLAWAFPTPVNISSLPNPPITSTNNITDLAGAIVIWIFWGLIVFSIIMALISAYRYVTSSGDPEKVQAAGKTLLYAAIGIVVALVAGGLPWIVSSFFGTQISCAVGPCPVPH